MFEIFVKVLQDAGGEMNWQDFITAVRVAGGQPENWLKAKHAGAIRTFIGPDGVLYAALPEGVKRGE